MRATPDELFIQNLEEAWPPGALYYMPKEQALEELRHLTGEDFGYDANAWRQWFRKNSVSRQKGKRGK